LFVHPLPDGVEHVPLYFNVLIAESWMVEDSKNIRHDLSNGYSWVLPGVDYSPKMKLVLGS